MPSQSSKFPASARARSDEVLATGLTDGEVRGRAARGGAVVVASQVARAALQVLSTAALARLVAPADFGLVAMAATLTVLFTMFSDLGLSQATVQRAEVTHGQLTTLFWINVAVGAALTLLCVLAAPLVAWFYGEPRVVPVVQALGTGFMLAGLSSQHGALLNRRLRFVVVAAISIVATFAGSLIAVVFAWYGYGVWALVAQQLGFALATLLGNWWASGWMPGRPQLAPGSGTMLRFGGNLTLYNLLIFFVPNADRILIGWYIGKHDLGLYDRCSNLITLPVRLVIMPLSNVMVPALSRLQDQPASYERFYLSTLEKIAMATIAPTLLLALLAPEVVAVLLGPDWSDATPILAWLALAAVGRPVGQSISWLFVSQGRTNEQLRMGVLVVLITFAGYVAGLHYGAAGVAAGVAATHLGILPLTFWLATRRGPVRYRRCGEAIVPGLVGGAALVAAVLALRAGGLTPEAPLAAAMTLTLAGGAATLLTYLAMPRARYALLNVLHLLVKTPAAPAASSTRS
ncbi:lipopolysaccharide biosynthesis protein [Marinivivus vitaminiproducens]|uniref:lipopolysaccharide biosynthesis protein n=1 Tax=Marinivivus vitaminiproducens TaxID=3035935 RepID=UPI00279EC5BE|nr:lipopolysaccharide biosynthesis protein [Geminicoccaceae bacterium SCSIO 64248]